MTQIDVRKIEMKDNKQLPFAPFAEIELVSYSGDGSGKIFLTPSCVSDMEIDCWADDLIEQINGARRKAKSHFATARGSAEWCSKRREALPTK